MQPLVDTFLTGDWLTCKLHKRYDTGVNNTDRFAYKYEIYERGSHMKISEKIICARKKAGMSQIDLADAMGVSRQSVSKWETGEANPEIGKLPQLAQILNVTVDWLLSEEDAQPVQQPLADERSANGSSPVFPPWMDQLPGWLGGIARRHGWLVGVHVAAVGVFSTFIGWLMCTIFRKGGEEAMRSHDAFEKGMRDFMGMSNTFQQEGDRMLEDGLHYATIFTSIFIVIGVILMVLGIILAIRLKKWGRRSNPLNCIRE